MTRQRIIIDANIIIRAALGKKVIALIAENYRYTTFYTPRVCYEDALKYLPKLFERRGQSSNPPLEVLGALEPFLNIIDESDYLPFMEPAVARIGMRDIDDWPVVASALFMDCPIWTEDTDFFGIGLPVWTTDRVSLYLFTSIVEVH